MRIIFNTVRQSTYDQCDYTNTDTDLRGVMKFLREAAEGTTIEVDTKIRTIFCAESGKELADTIRIRLVENHFQPKEIQKAWWAGLRVPMKNEADLGYAFNVIVQDAYNEWKYGAGCYHTNRVYYFMKKKSINFFV